MNEAKNHKKIMNGKIIQNLNHLKQEFFKTYSGNSHIQEIIPSKKTKFLDIDSTDLVMLHKFAESNPIYHNSYEEKILDVNCIVYEGDINQYWINSLKHDSSAQPFYPTWILSAYFVSQCVKDLGFKEIIDIGSGDGRISYCAKILGLNSVGIEIDEFLVDLQKSISADTGLSFKQICDDATQFDYSSLNLTKPAIFTGGLPQMGDVLATNIIEKIIKSSYLKQNSCFVLAGSNSSKQFSVSAPHGGWAPIIQKYNLKIIKTITLPTVWTFDQPESTPYLFTVFI